MKLITQQLEVQHRNQHRNQHLQLSNDESFFPNELLSSNLFAGIQQQPNGLKGVRVPSNFLQNLTTSRPVSSKSVDPIHCLSK